MIFVSCTINNMIVAHTHGKYLVKAYDRLVLSQ